MSLYGYYQMSNTFSKYEKALSRIRPLSHIHDTVATIQHIFATIKTMF